MPTRALLQAAASTGLPWLDRWGVPLIVSLIALGGVIFASLWNGRKMIEAENVRAQNTITAEDRRAAAAIEAENLRHENDMRRATREHLLDSVRDLYVDLETARRELTEASFPLSEIYDDLGEWREHAAREREVFEAASQKFSVVHDKVKLLGSKEVGALASKVWSLALDAEFASDRLMGEDMPMSKVNTIAEFQRVHRFLRKHCDNLLEAMRREFHQESEQTRGD